MGMDLCVVGFSVRRDQKTDRDAVAAVLRTIHPTDEDMNAVDPSGGFFDDAEGFWDRLETGLDEYISALDAHRLASVWPISNSDNDFVMAGGSSFGDDPYDGWSELCLFINALEHFPQLREQTNFAGSGVVA